MRKAIISSLILLGCLTQLCFANPKDQNISPASGTPRTITKSIVNSNNALPVPMNNIRNTGVSVTSGVITDILSISLGVGTWLVVGSGTVTTSGGYSDYVLTWASTSSATFPASPYFAGATATGTSGFGVVIPPQIFTVSSGTLTVYLSALSAFTGTGTGTGTLTAVSI